MDDGECRVEGLWQALVVVVVVVSTGVVASVEVAGDNDD